MQQDPHENIREYVQRSSKIIQVHSGKTNLKEIAASQYGWNLVQGLTNISIKNKIADHISHCQSLSDVCKLVKQVKREMENREAFTGISVEAEESVEEVNWRQHNYNQRVIIEATIEVTTIKQATILKREVTRIAIIVVMAIQVNRQVTAVQYLRQVMLQMFNAYYVD